MRVTGRKIELPVRADRAGWACSNAELAFETRVVGNRMGLLADFGVDQYGTEENEVAEFRMDYVPVDAHLPQTRSYCDRLVRDYPHLRSPVIGFHGKPSRPAVDCADSELLQCRHDPPCHLVRLIRRMVEFEVGNRPRRRPNILPFHPHDR